MKYPHLFEPVKLGSTVLRNRIFASATGLSDYSFDGAFSDTAVAYYARKAQGGAAAVAIGECEIDPKGGGKSTGLCVDLSSFGTVAGLWRLANAITAAGAVCSPELQHHGRYGVAALGPSDGEDHGKPCHAMTEEQILATIKSYAAAASNCKMAGCGMVTVHGGHGWLPEQFFAEWTNQRTDRWGGSLENRTRFAVAVCDAIHERCGRDFPIEFRISGTEFEDGYGVDEGIQYAMALDGHADIIHVSVGLHGSGIGPGFFKSYPKMFVKEGKNVHFAAEINKHIKQSLVACVGGMSTPEYMEEVIASGQADIVAIARGLICDPDLPNKARSGREDEIRHCVRCLSCFSNLFPSGRILCAMNPETGRELEAGQVPPQTMKKVLVAGGGIAGMEAALTAARQGHDVTLCEKSDHLGGAITCEEAVPFKANLTSYLIRQEEALLREGVRVKLNTEVTPEFIEEGGYEAVVAALGSEAAVPSIPGIDGKTVLPAEEAYRSPEKCGQKVVILGAGLVGTELAIYLHSLGKEPTVLELAPMMRMDGAFMHGSIVRMELEKRRIPVHLRTAAKRIDPDGVTTEDGCFFPADTVVYATGRKPNYEEAAALSAASPSFAFAGDCTGVKNIMNATKTGWQAGLNIGR